MASGLSVGVDLALVVDVLSNPDDCGEDPGVFNMAIALPQTVATVSGATLPALNSTDNHDDDLLRWTAGVRRWPVPWSTPDQEG